MYDGAVLHVRALANAYVENIAAHHGVEPDGGLRPYMHVAYDLRALFYKGCRMNLRVDAAKWSDHDRTQKGSEKFPQMKARTVT